MLEKMWKQWFVWLSALVAKLHNNLHLGLWPVHTYVDTALLTAPTCMLPLGSSLHTSTHWTNHILLANPHWVSERNWEPIVLTLKFTSNPTRETADNPYKVHRSWYVHDQLPITAACSEATDIFQTTNRIGKASKWTLFHWESHRHPLHALIWTHCCPNMDALLPGIQQGNSRALPHRKLGKTENVCMWHTWD